MLQAKVSGVASSPDNGYNVFLAAGCLKAHGRDAQKISCRPVISWRKAGLRQDGC
jgi:hypothetical protein